MSQSPMLLTLADPPRGKESLRLNLGCWVQSFRLPQSEGWVNIDLNADYVPDLVADATKLPYSNATVDEIYAGHLLEHIPQHVYVLSEWWRVLRPGGVLTVTVPDLELSLELYRKGEMDRYFLNQVAFGGADESPLQKHHRVYTGRVLYEEMQAAGFGCLEYMSDPGIKWQITVRGRKPEDEC